MIGTSPSGWRQGWACAKCALGDGDTQGVVTEPDHHVPLLSPFPRLCHPHLCLSQRPWAPAWASQELGGRRAGDALPLPRPAGLCGHLPAGLRRRRAGHGPGEDVRRACASSSHQQPPPLTGTAMQWHDFFCCSVFS